MIKFGKTIPIIIHPLFWLVAALLGWMSTSTLEGTAIWVVIVLYSVLVHEYGHALTVMAFGQKPHIELVGFGGVTKRSSARKLKAWQEFLIVLNGPVAGFILCGVAWLVKQMVQTSPINPTLFYIISMTFYVNLFWTILNLLPVQPLDGGKLLMIVLESFFGIKGTKIALFISFILAVLFGLFFFSVQAFIAGAFFLMFAYESFLLWKNSLAIVEDDQSVMLQQLYKDAERDLLQGHKEAALEKLQSIRQLTKSGLLHVASSENVAVLLAEQGLNQEAYDILLPLKSKLRPQSLKVLQQLAYRLGKWQETVTIGDKAFHLLPDYEIAVINAFCYSQLEQVKPAIGWIRCAIREGLPHLQDLLAHKEFDSIRRDPLFQELQSSQK